MEPIGLVGAPGSPYSRKLVALMRYRRIPHRWITRGSPESRGLPKPRVELLPQLLLPNDAGELEARTDTTPLLRQLEANFPERSVVPEDAVLAFADLLLEDFADEWLTKAMFHYRWAYRDDIDKAARILPRWFALAAPEEAAVRAGEQFAERQIERLWVVGSNETTGPVIEASYRRLLALLSARLETARFMLGARPGSCDFALYGQLTQLVGFDPTPSAIALADAPRVVAWVDLVDDLSGVSPNEADWMPREDLEPALAPLLGEVGRVYAPFLLANAAALEAGAERVEATIDGQPWVQRPFPYQGKCLATLRGAYAALETYDRQAVDALLDGTGCEALFG